MALEKLRAWGMGEEGWSQNQPQSEQRARALGPNSVASLGGRTKTLHSSQM
jgi:hypothetical protein